MCIVHMYLINKQLLIVTSHDFHVKLIVSYKDTRETKKKSLITNLLHMSFLNFFINNDLTSSCSTHAEFRSILYRIRNF